MNAVQLPGGVRVTDLAEATGVSEMTIRRDLEELELQGMLRRVHGGAVGLPARGTMLPFSMRLDSETHQKMKIAQAAANLIPNGVSVIIDTGTTCTAVAAALTGRDITALALSIHIAAALGTRPGARIITPGGELNPDELAWTGHRAIQASESFRADYAILGVCAWDERSGLTATTTHDADLKRAIIASSRNVIAVATSGKIGICATFTVCATEHINTLITDGVSHEASLWLSTAEVEIIETS